MEFVLNNGDYVLDETGRIQRAQGAQEVLQRVLFRLQARRGALPFLPQLGSQIARLPQEKPSARPALAMRYAAQALEGEPDVRLLDAVFQPESAGRWILTVTVQWQGETLTASTAF